MPIAAIFTFLKSAISALLEVGSEVLSTRVGQILLALIVGMWLGYSHASNDYEARIHNEQMKREAAERVWQAEVKAEARRREQIIATAAAKARDDAQALEELSNKLDAIQKENSHASRANDRRTCVDADSVRRLNRLTP